MPIDYSKYPANWKSEIVPRILARANNRCEVCGLKNKQIIYAGRLYVRVRGRYSWRVLWFADKGDMVRAGQIIDKFRNVRVVLTIAHLDHDETNHDVQDDRLQAMCQKCHLAYDSEEKYRRACCSG